MASGIVLLDEVGPEVFKRVKDGAKLRVHDDRLMVGDRRLARGTTLEEHDIASMMIDAKTGLVDHLEAFSGNTIEFIRSESPLLIDGVGVPDVDVSLAGKHVVIVADGPDRGTELRSLKPFIKEYSPVLVGVGAGADTLVKAGYKPAIVVGDPEQMKAATLRCGAQVVLPPTPTDTPPASNASRTSASERRLSRPPEPRPISRCCSPTSMVPTSSSPPATAGPSTTSSTAHVVSRRRRRS